MSEVELDRFFRPQSVAVVGASDTAGSQPAYYTDSLRRWAEWVGARFYPVNPNRETVGGAECFSSLDALPESVDLAVILTSRATEAVRDAVSSGVRFAVLFAAGFAESGPEGVARQAELGEAIRGSQLRLLGPNTNPNAFQILREDLAGPGIALVTQSGAQGRPVFQGQELGIPISHWAPTGNELDLEAADFIRYFAEHADCAVIAGYLEGFGDGDRLREAARTALERGVPIVLVMPGRTEIGRSWVETHTAHRASDQEILAGFFRQYGIARVRDLDHLCETSALLLRWPAPAGDGVCVYSMSGGTAAHVADLAAECGLRLPALSSETRERLREWIPDFLRIDNPVDSGGVGVFDDRHRKMVETLLEAPEVDILVVPIPGSIGEISDKFARDVIEAAKAHNKRVCVVWGSPVGTETAYREVLLPSGIPVFRTYANCLEAIRSYLDYHQTRERWLRASSATTEASADLDSLAEFEIESGAGAEEGIPLSIEVLSDALFPAAVAIELGEALVDSLRDRVVAVAPFTAGDATEMLANLRGVELLSERHRIDLVRILEVVARAAQSGKPKRTRYALRTRSGAGVAIFPPAP